MTFWKPITVGALSALALSLTACSGDDDEGSSMAVTSTSDAATAVASEVVASSTDGRVAQLPDSGVASRSEELAVTQVQNSFEAVRLGGAMNDQEVLETGRAMCFILDHNPGYLGEAIINYHNPESPFPSAMIPPTLVREFCPSYYPSEDDLGAMFAEAWGGDTWYPGQN